MENWKKIRSFKRAYEADLRKEILKNNDIAAVVLASQDSSFLLGDFELFVEEKNIDTAGIILQEFKGWTKINSCTFPKPVEIIETHLKNEQFDVFATRNILLNEYELYVKNEEADKVKDAIETMKPWVLLDSYETAKQAEYRIEQLEKYEIDSIIIKRRASDRHLINVDLLVAPSNYKVATEVSEEMMGWHLVAKFEEKKEALLTQKLIEKEGIQVLTKYIISEDDDIARIEQFVNHKDIENSKKLISENKKWVQFASYKKLYQVEMLREILNQNNINSVFINEKGSMFLLGEMLVYVEEKEFEKAKSYLTSWEEALQPTEE